MKSSISILTLLLSTLVASEGIMFAGISVGGSQKILEGGEDIPGANPLTHCQKVHDDDLLTIDHVELTPNPPAAGASLSIEAVGTLKEQIEKGAYIDLSVKYGLIKLVNTQADLCEQVANVDLSCPLEKGKTVIKKDVDLPKEIPPGTYTVTADAYTVDKRKILCLQATVTFSR